MVVRRRTTESERFLHRDHFQGGREKLPGAFPNAASELLPLAQDEVGLHQGVSQEHEQRLVDHQGEGTGMHPGEVPKALVLSVPLFDGGTEFIGRTEVAGGELWGSADENPIVRLAVLIALAVHHGG